MELNKYRDQCLRGKMNEITEHNLINSIKEKFPKSHSFWQVYFNKWGLNTSVGNQMEPFVEYIVNEIKSENYDEVENIFNYIEFLLCNGDGLVQVVVENCFLVPLIYKNNNEIQFLKFSKYLGKETLDFLRTWLKLDGTFIKGL